MDQSMADLLTLSRAQRMEIPNDEVAGRTLVLDAVEQLEENIRQAGARVTIAQDFPHFRVNAIWATQAIYNR